MIKIAVIGGGWSGCAAALAAAKAGAQVLLLERTDLLLGTGLVGGIFRNNGRFTAAEETIAMGCGDLFVAMDANARHKALNFPQHNHSSLYDVNTIEPLVKKILQNYGIEIKTQTRISNIVRFGRKLQAVIDDNETIIRADAFVDATGTSGPMGNCLRYGNGCCMCVLRCPTFGPRVSIAGKSEIKEFMGQKADESFGAMSGSCKLNKDSLSPELKERLNKEGMLILPLPSDLITTERLNKKACSQYVSKDFFQSLVILDTGHAKIMTPYFPLESLRRIPGLEKARYEDPYSGGVGNSIRYMALTPCSASLQVEGMDNLFCAGEKTGPIVGHTEAVITGLLAGNNAVRHCIDMQYLQLPRQLACGDFIAFMQSQLNTAEGIKHRYTFSGAKYFEHMKKVRLYSTNKTEITQRVAAAGLSDIYSRCLV